MLHEKFKVENVEQILLKLAKRQINVILSGNLDHVQTLQNFIAPQVQGQMLWNYITR